MHDAFGVRRGESVAHLERVIENSLHGERPKAEVLSQGLPFQQLHDEIRQALMGPDVVDCQDVRMVQRARRARFEFEATQTVHVAGQIGREDLDGDVPPETGVEGLVDLSHTSRANRGEDAVGTKLDAGCKSHDKESKAVRRGHGTGNMRSGRPGVGFLVAGQGNENEYACQTRCARTPQSGACITTASGLLRSDSAGPLTRAHGPALLRALRILAPQIGITRGSSGPQTAKRSAGSLVRSRPGLAVNLVRSPFDGPAPHVPHQSSGPGVQACGSKAADEMDCKAT